ncbi:MAG: TRAFs-binding domain-containing protein, partial [Rhodocyclaceae bacterium]
MASPIAFVLMPFGQKKDAPTGKTIDFDDVFARLIAPGIEAASMVPLRGDLETSLGIIHKRFFEKLMLCEFAVADLTTSNANVFYEFGVRHAIRPRTTLALSAHPENLPFDVAPLSVVPYQLDARGLLVDAAVAGTVAAIAEKLLAAKADVRGRPLDRPDSPLFSLITGYRAPDLAHLRADVFPERVADEVAVAERIAAIRARALASDPDDKAARQHAFAEATAALDAIRAQLGDLDDERTDVLTKLMLAYRAISAWDRMVVLIEDFPAPLNRQTLPREQLGMALNRIAETKEKVK